jgi:hypothetical protein
VIDDRRPSMFYFLLICLFGPVGLVGNVRGAEESQLKHKTSSGEEGAADSLNHELSHVQLVQKFYSER